MDIDTAADLGRQALYITILVSMPAMITGMVVGLIISLIQSITSIQEQTISTVPRIIISLIVVVISLPWVLTHVIEYTVVLYRTIPERL